MLWMLVRYYGFLIVLDHYKKNHLNPKNCKKKQNKHICEYYQNHHKFMHFVQNI